MSSHKEPAGPKHKTKEGEELMMTKLLSKPYSIFGLTLLALVITGQAAVRTAQAQDQIGQLTVVGMVKVDGKPAATGDIVSSGSSVHTAAKSSAVVSLGKLGRVEALPDTKMELRYDGTSITVMLEAGRVRVSTGTGVAATVIRKE